MLVLHVYTTEEKQILQCWVLESKGSIKIARLEESNKARVDSLIWVASGIGNKRCLVGLVHVFPVVGSFKVFLRICHLPQSSGHLGDAEIIVRIFDRARYGSSEWATSIRVKIVSGNVSERFPACQSTTAFNCPIQRFVYNLTSAKFMS